jgi:hypothetical protein
LERIKDVVSSEFNYKSLRFKMQSISPPAIPYIGVYQGDLVFLDKMGKNRMDKGLVNFHKLHKMASYVLELKVGE